MVVGVVSDLDTGYILVGALQFITAPFIVGWIWSIAWGARSLGKEEERALLGDAAPLLGGGGS